MGIVNWWSYPYVKIYENYIPIAILILLIFSVLVSAFCICNFIFMKLKSAPNIKAQIVWCHNLISDLTKYVIYTMLIIAFAETDKEYILYKIINESILAFRQIDAFIYAIFVLLFISALKYKNCYTYINKLLKSLICVNVIEMIALVFLKYNNGEKGALSIAGKLVLILYVIIVNCIFLNIKFINFIKQDMLKSEECKLFENRDRQMDEIIRKIVTYDKEEQMTIFLSDEWGGGKTFFARFLFNQLKLVRKFNLIWVNLTDFSHEEVFIKQILKKIQSELNSKNYFTGKASEFNKYMEAALNISLNPSVAKVALEQISINNVEETEKYLSLSEMSDEISDMLGDDRIVILIDDMDRCTDETIKAALKLFSDIIFLPKTIIIFVGDYKQLLSKPGLEEGFFDKYFMFNYNLYKVSYKYLLDYYSYLLNFNSTMSFEISKELDKLFDSIDKWCIKEETHGLAENDYLYNGAIRNCAVDELSAVVDNMRAGMTELKKRLSNPRRVIRLYQEVTEQLDKLNSLVENCEMDCEKLKQSIYDCILFYSLARTVCTDRFWNICADNFVNFEEDVLETINRMGEPYNDQNSDELLYMLLVYYFLSTRFQDDGNRIKEFKTYFTTRHLKTSR